MKIHPAADLFPMMSDEELNDLAADIQANGLIHPIIVDDEEQVIDGRNRLAACKLAGIKPTFEKLNGQDPLAYIVSANLARRNLTKGQKAMAHAMIYPEAEKGGRGNKTVRNPNSFSKVRLSEARTVLHHSRKLADAVLQGVTPLDQALEQVQVEEGRIISADAQLKRLQADAPDLADQVDEGRLKLAEAWAAYQERKKSKESAEQAATQQLQSLMITLQPRNRKPEEVGQYLFDHINPKFWVPTPNLELNKKYLTACARALTAVADLWAQKEK